MQTETELCPACGGMSCFCAYHQPPRCAACDDEGCHVCDPIDFDDDSDTEDPEWE